MNIELFKFCKNYLTLRFNYTKRLNIIKIDNYDFSKRESVLQYPTNIEIKNLYLKLDNLINFNPVLLDNLFDSYFYTLNYLIHKLNIIKENKNNKDYDLYLKLLFSIFILFSLALYPGILEYAFFQSVYDFKRNKRRLSCVTCS